MGWTKIREESRYWLERAAAAARARKHGWPRRAGVRVWRFHGFVDSLKDRHVYHYLDTKRQFVECLNAIQRLPPITIEEIAHAFTEKGKKKLPQNGALVTFDDGYRSTVWACEEAMKRGVRTAVFVCPGHQGGETIWTAELCLLILRGGASKIDMLGRRWELSNEEQKWLANRRIEGELRSMATPQRRMAMEQLRQQFPPGRLQELLEDYEGLQLMCWQEICYLCSLGVEVGGHGMWHEIHNEAQQPEVVDREVRKAKQIIERNTGQQCRGFAYPNGGWTSHSIDALSAAGYAIAFTTQRGIVMEGMNPYLLPRMKGSRLSTTIRDGYYDAEVI